MTSSTDHVSSRPVTSGKRRRQRRRRKSKQAEADPFESEETQEPLRETEWAIQDLLSETMPRKLKPGFTLSSQTQYWRGRLGLMLAKLDFVTDLLDPNEREYLELCWAEPDSEESIELDKELDKVLAATTSHDSGSKRKISLDYYIRCCDESLARLEEAVPVESGQSWVDRLSGFFRGATSDQASYTESNSAWSDTHQARLDRLHRLTTKMAELRDDCIEQWERQLEEQLNIQHPARYRPEHDDGPYFSGPYAAENNYYDLPDESHPVRFHSYRDPPPPWVLRYRQDPETYQRTSWGKTVDDLGDSMVQTTEKAFEIGTGCLILAGGAYMAAKATSWLCSSTENGSTNDHS